MPKATTDINDTTREDLKSCPPDGFVVLRRFNYGEKLDRQAMATHMSIQAAKGGAKEDAEMTLKTANRAVAEFEFRSLIVDHNLTDGNDVKLDFRSPMTIQMLDPRIGDEISQLIQKMNDFEDSLGNSESVSSDK